MDPLFPDKVRAINVEDEAIKTKLPILDCYFTNQPEWDPAGAGKNLPVAELLCRWVNVIQEYYAQEEVRYLSSRSSIRRISYMLLGAIEIIFLIAENQTIIGITFPKARSFEIEGKCSQ